MRPLLGRIFNDEEDDLGAPRTVILSYGLWRSEFGGREDVLGKTVRLDEVAHVVIGVMPPAFTFPTREAQLWTPLEFSDENGDDDRGNNYLQVLARLRPGVSIDAARAEMNVIAEQLERQFPKENRDARATIHLLRDQVSAESRLLLIGLTGASLCVLLIACTNLAGLLLARVLRRRKELAMRTAMGAGHERLVRQLLTESLLLSATGGLLGLAMRGQRPGSLRPARGIARWRGPPHRAAAIGPCRLGSGRLGRAAGVGRPPHSGALAGPVGRARLQPGERHRDADAASDHEIRSDVAPRRPLLAHPGRRPGAARRDERRLCQLPAHGHARRHLNVKFLDAPGRVDEFGNDPSAILRFVTPGLFETLGIPLRAGRDIRESDTFEANGVAVVSESLVKRYLPGVDPIGRRIDFALRERTIVGVVGDIRVRGLERVSEPQAYVSYRQVRDGNIIWYLPKELVIRSATDPTTLVPAVRRIVRTADPDVPIAAVRTLTEVVAADTASRSTQLRVLTAFAALSLVLAGIGLQGCCRLRFRSEYMRSASGWRSARAPETCSVSSSGRCSS